MSSLSLVAFLASPNHYGLCSPSDLWSRVDKPSLSATPTPSFSGLLARFAVWVSSAFPPDPSVVLQQTI